MIFHVPRSRACCACTRILLTPSSSGLCHRCHQECTPLAYDPHAAIDGVFAYEGPLKAPLARLKYNRDVGIARMFADLLAPRIARLARDAPIVVVPMPMSAGRRWRRGCNHTELIAQWLPLRDLEIRLLPRGVLSRRHRPAQVGLSRTQRASNAAGAFTLHPHRSVMLRGTSVLILDDVISTGSTMRACMNALRRSGASQLRGLALLRRVA